MRVGNQFSPIYDGLHFAIQAAHTVCHVPRLPLAHGSFDEQTIIGMDRCEEGHKRWLGRFGIVAKDANGFIRPTGDIYAEVDAPIPHVRDWLCFG